MRGLRQAVDKRQNPANGFRFKLPDVLAGTTKWVFLCALLSLQFPGDATAQRGRYRPPPRTYTYIAPVVPEVTRERIESDQAEPIPPKDYSEATMRRGMQNVLTAPGTPFDYNSVFAAPAATRPVIFEPVTADSLFMGFDSRKSGFSDFLAEQKIDRKEPPPDVFEQFSAWQTEKKLSWVKGKVRSLTATEKWLLDRYITEVEPDRRPNFDSEVRHWEAWSQSKAGLTRDARSSFPAFALPERKQADVFAAMPDQQMALDAQRANAAYIEAHPALARLQTEGWNLDAANPAQLGKMLQALARPLPGNQPQLFYFFDPKSSQHDALTHDISTAWEGRGGEPASYLLHQNIEQFIEERRGTTVIMVGHIFGTNFAMERGAGAEPLLIDIPTLLRTAAERQVWLIPIGCNSASSGAPFGFTRSIDSIEVAKFIEAIPRDALAVGDLLAAIGAIAPVSVNVSALADHLDFAIRFKSDPEPAVMTRVPAPMPARPLPTQSQTAGSSASLPADYQQFTTNWIKMQPPEADAGLLGWLRKFVDIIGLVLLAIAAVLACVDLALHRAMLHVHGTTRAPGTRLYTAQRYIRRIWAVAAVAAIFYILWTPWFYIILGIAAAIWFIDITFLRPNNAGRPHVTSPKR